MFFVIYHHLAEVKAQIRNEGSERGASAVEYGLLIAGIAALVALVVFALGGAISGLFTDMTDAL